MKTFWLAVALVLTAGAGIAAAQTDIRGADTRVAAAGLYSPIPKTSPGTTKVAACSGRMVSSCSSQASESTCNGSFVESSSSSGGTTCVWSGGRCMTGSSC